MVRRQDIGELKSEFKALKGRKTEYATKLYQLIRYFSSG
jgi:hypothetical protein